MTGLVALARYGRPPQPLTNGVWTVISLGQRDFMEKIKERRNIPSGTSIGEISTPLTSLVNSLAGSVKFGMGPWQSEVSNTFYRSSDTKGLISIVHFPLKRKGDLQNQSFIYIRILPGKTSQYN